MSTRPTARLKAPAPDRQAHAPKPVVRGQNLVPARRRRDTRPHQPGASGAPTVALASATPALELSATSVPIAGIGLARRAGCIQPLGELHRQPLSSPRSRRPRRNLGMPERSGAVPAIHPSEAARSGSTDRTTLTMSTTTTSRPKPPATGHQAPAPAREARPTPRGFRPSRARLGKAAAVGHPAARAQPGGGLAGRADRGRREAGPPVAQLARSRRPRRNLGMPERSGAVPAIHPSEAARSGPTDRTTLTMSTTTTSRPKAPAPAHQAPTQRHPHAGPRPGQTGARTDGQLGALSRCPRRNLGSPERSEAVPAIHPSEAARSGPTDRTILTMSTTTTSRPKAPATGRRAHSSRSAAEPTGPARRRRGTAGHRPDASGTPTEIGSATPVPPTAPGIVAGIGLARRFVRVQPGGELRRQAFSTLGADGRGEISARLKDSGRCRPCTPQRPPSAARPTGPHSR